MSNFFISLLESWDSVYFLVSIWYRRLWFLSFLKLSLTSVVIVCQKTLNHSSKVKTNFPGLMSEKVIEHKTTKVTRPLCLIPRFYSSSSYECQIVCHYPLMTISSRYLHLWVRISRDHWTGISSMSIST